MLVAAASIAHHPVTTLGSCLLAALMLTSAARPVAAQDTTMHGRTTASVAGVVRDSLGHPITLATVSVDSETRRAATDDGGQFVIRGLAPGHVGFHVLRIGYEPVAFVLDLPADSTVHVEIRLHGSALLKAVIVQGQAMSERLARTGFYDRRRLTNGQFLTPEQVDSSFANNPSELLRAFHGIDVICGGAPTTDPSKSPEAVLPKPRSPAARRSLPPTTGGGCTMKSRGAGCLWLFVDGQFVDAQLDEITSRAEVAAVEFYERNNDVPLQLQAPMRGSSCAAVAVWTKPVAR